MEAAISAVARDGLTVPALMMIKRSVDAGIAVEVANAKARLAAAPSLELRFTHFKSFTDNILVRNKAGRYCNTPFHSYFHSVKYFYAGFGLHGDDGYERAWSYGF